MRGIQEAREKLTDLAPHVSLSLHCETAEIMTAYTKLVEKDKSLKGLAAYSASRPPHSEGLAVFIASWLFAAAIYRLKRYDALDVSAGETAG